MADKYIIEGAAFNGDGTSSAEATSNGGVGAWNTITYFEGATPAYGTLAAGDVVYIRSKTAAGADITRTFSTTINLGSSAATQTNPIKWVLDGGAVWSGVSGTFTFTSSASSINLRNYNSLYADVRGSLIFISTASNASQSALSLGDACEVKHALFDLSAQTVNGAYLSASGNRNRLTSCDFKSGSRMSTAALISNGDYGHMTVVDPSIELVRLTSGALFKPGQYGAKIEVVGGTIFGAGASTGAYLARLDNSSHGVSIFGTLIPKTMSFAYPSTSSGYGFLEVIGADGGAGAVFVDWRTGEMDSRSDGYYPTLNAFLPTTTQTPWSWKVWPNKTTRNVPFKVPSMKLYTGDAGVKTLTCNFLIADSVTGADTESTWLEVEYIDDATGVRKHIDTRTIDGSPLETSTAPWSATTYGAVNLLKRQIQVTTPTAVKKDTLVIATLRSFVNATSANDLMFVCPDVVMT